MISPIFNIQDIKVLENSEVSADTIISLSGLSKGQNIFRFLSSNVEEQIKDFNHQLQQEDVLNDYKKYNEVTQNIDETNRQLEKLLEQWENMQMD